MSRGYDGFVLLTISILKLLKAGKELTSVAIVHSKQNPSILNGTLFFDFAFFRKITIVGVLGTMLLLFSSKGAWAMAGIFGTNTLFSAVSGRVVINGVPVSGVLVEQWVKNSSGKPVEKTVTTDESGYFEFPEVTQGKRIADFLPSAFVTQQEINFTYSGKKISGWVYTKNDPMPGSESDGKKFSLICDVGTEPDYAGGYYGVCRLELD